MYNSSKKNRCVVTLDIKTKKAIYAFRKNCAFAIYYFLFNGINVRFVRVSHIMCGPKHREFWMSPAGLKTSYALLVLNICGVLGWIAASIYVSVECGQNKKYCSNLWMWAMPFACHFWGIMGSIRCIRAHKTMNCTTAPGTCSNKC